MSMFQSTEISPRIVTKVVKDYILPMFEKDTSKPQSKIKTGLKESNDHDIFKSLKFTEYL